MRQLFNSTKVREISSDLVSILSCLGLGTNAKCKKYALSKHHCRHLLSESKAQAFQAEETLLEAPIRSRKRPRFNVAASFIVLMSKVGLVLNSGI
ncbi:hypothetical protein QYF36_020043 [Acer negundo]|nr:hypothetical protein QYF36_020043 [Acer negundo]